MNRTRARDAKETKTGDDGEDVRKNGANPNSLEKDMSEKVNDVNKKCEMNDVGNNLRPDRMFCGPENLEKKKMEKEMDLADNVCESVEGWGRWAEPSSGSELKDEHR